LALAFCRTMKPNLIIRGDDLARGMRRVRFAIAGVNEWLLEDEDLDRRVVEFVCGHESLNAALIDRVELEHSDDRLEGTIWFHEELPK
jgi:hypothetical protein